MAIPMREIRRVDWNRLEFIVYANKQLMRPQFAFSPQIRPDALHLINQQVLICLYLYYMTTIISLKEAKIETKTASTPLMT